MALVFLNHRIGDGECGLLDEAHISNNTTLNVPVDAQATWVLCTLEDTQSVFGELAIVQFLLLKTSDRRNFHFFG
jgi:hypothetical protein